MSNEEKLTEASRAVIEGDCRKIDTLIAEGFSVNTRSEGDEWNLLHIALVSITSPPSPKVIAHLIELGAEVNARDRYSWTPLHFAVRTKSGPVVRLLIDAGAEIDAANNEGITPLHQCLLVYPRNLQIVEMLLAAGANPTRVWNLAKAAASPDREAVLSLLQRYIANDG